MNDYYELLEETAQRPPQWAESLAEHIEVLRAQVAPVAGP
jgi:hypothetical protein